MHLQKLQTTLYFSNVDFDPIADLATVSPTNLSSLPTLETVSDTQIDSVSPSKDGLLAAKTPAYSPDTFEHKGKATFCI